MEDLVWPSLDREVAFGTKSCTWVCIPTFRSTIRRVTARAVEGLAHLAHFHIPHCPRIRGRRDGPSRDHNLSGVRWGHHLQGVAVRIPYNWHLQGNKSRRCLSQRQRNFCSYGIESNMYTVGAFWRSATPSAESWPAAPSCAPATFAAVETLPDGCG